MKVLDHEPQEKCQTQGHTRDPSQPGDSTPEGTRRITIRSWNNILINQTIQTLWFKNSDDEERDKQIKAIAAALMGIAPKDELEGMMAAQLLAAHNAAMECYRRAMHSEQTFEGRRENLNQANKLSRSSAVLLEALNRHRGKGQQKVTVEHVTVNAGGQAIVGSVPPRGEGCRAILRINPMHLPMLRAPRCGARTRNQSACLAPAMRNGRCRLHGGALTLVRRPARSSQPPSRQGSAAGHELST